VGIDMDETLMTGYNIMDDEVIPDFLGTLSTKEIQFFCLTAGISSSWQGRRKRFNKVGLNEIFCNLELNGPFSRSWIEGSDNSKKYYWDFEYSIMYSTIETKYGHKETSKGEVFKSAIEDRIITKPDVMVFIDDLLGNVEDMRLACYQLGINCLGIHCNLPTSSHLKRSHLEQPMYLERLIAETEAGQSKIINCINWDHIINEVVYQHIRHHRDENILVGIDVDDTLIGNHGIIDSRAIPKFFKKLRKREIPFFCFTAAISCFWQKKRVDFKEAGLNNFLCNSVANVPFSRSWQKSLDDSKKYYWDFEYSTMYSTKAKMVSRFFEENPLELGLYQIGDLTKVSK
jgi:hypothetical protein